MLYKAGVVISFSALNANLLLEVNSVFLFQSPASCPLYSCVCMIFYPLSGSRYNKSVGRRGSYLYMSDTDEDEPVVTRSRASSMSSHIGDETYVTPFAQVRRLFLN